MNENGDITGPLGVGIMVVGIIGFLFELTYSFDNFIIFIKLIIMSTIFPIMSIYIIIFLMGLCLVLYSMNLYKNNTREV